MSAFLPQSCLSAGALYPSRVRRKEQITLGDTVSVQDQVGNGMSVQRLLGAGLEI